MDYQFDFELTLEKAESREGRMFVQGVASTTNTDLQNDAFSPNALRSMAANAIGIPLVQSHNHEIGDEIGVIQRAEVQDHRLLIEGELDKDDVLAQRLFKKIQKSGRAGFSVGASLLAVKPGLNKARILDDVRLNHVMITSKPVNRDCFAVAVMKALTSTDLEKAADVSEEQRKTHATYFEDGKGKFPIFDKATAESALKLIGHAPESKQSLIRQRACAILGAEHPGCGDDANKSEDLNTMKKETIEKAGKEFSAANRAKLQAIHDSTSDEGVKSALADMLNSAPDEIVESPDESAAEGEAQASAPEAPSASEALASGPSDDGSYFSGVAKAELDAAVAEAIAPKLATLEGRQKELEAAISAFKSETEKLKTVSRAANPLLPPAPDIAELRKGHRNDSELFGHLLLNAVQKANNGG